MLRQDKRGRQGGVRARHARRPAHPERWQEKAQVHDPVNYPNRLKQVLFSDPDPDCLAAAFLLSPERLSRDLTRSRLQQANSM